MFVVVTVCDVTQSHFWSLSTAMGMCDICVTIVNQILSKNLKETHKCYCSIFLFLKTNLPKIIISSSSIFQIIFFLSNTVVHYCDVLLLITCSCIDDDDDDKDYDDDDDDDDDDIANDAFCSKCIMGIKNGKILLERLQKKCTSFFNYHPQCERLIPPGMLH